MYNKIALPPFSSTACSLLGIDSTSPRKYSEYSIFVTHRFRISACSWGMDVTFFSWSWFFIQLQAFSIGFMSGELPGQLMSVIWGRCWSHSWTPSCRKCVVPCRFINSSSLSYRIFLYQTPFIISSLSRNSRAALPFQLKLAQAMVLAGCFVIFLVNLRSGRLILPISIHPLFSVPPCKY